MLSYLPLQLGNSSADTLLFTFQLDHSGDDSPLLTFVAGPRWWWHSPIYRGSWTTVVATVSYLPLQLGHGGSNAFLLALDLCDITQHLGHLIRIEVGGAGLCLNGGCLQMIFLHITLYFFPLSTYTCVHMHMWRKKKKKKKRLIMWQFFVCCCYDWSNDHCWFHILWG